MKKFILALVCVFALTCVADASPRRGFRGGRAFFFGNRFFATPVVVATPSFAVVNPGFASVGYGAVGVNTTFGVGTGCTGAALTGVSYGANLGYVNSFQTVVFRNGRFHHVGH